MEKFLQDIFEKAQNETGIESLRGRCEYISETVLEDYKYPISYKSLERYFKGETTPKGETKDVLAKYLGYVHFKDYLLKNQDSEPTKKEAQADAKISSAINGVRQWILIGLIPIVAGAGYVGFVSGKKECMVWKEDHYEVTTCTGQTNEEIFKEYKLKNFRQIEVSDTTTFFKNAKVQVWYDKTNKELTFFSGPGINPENGKTLRPITNYMIEKYVYSRKD